MESPDLIGLIVGACILAGLIVAFTRSRFNIWARRQPRDGQRFHDDEPLEEAEEIALRHLETP
ncbi:uncharacterized protein EI97DRAFT_435211 [Westerdykella ornata]|uniref:Uncharacterized protein n=1 Tax=Westerdykella ornata TaxID=318751 RepID=A0A6A6JGM3_WESOR|nr:uncharacterized protein EI97DRAFT_435211 [Westerdykella ornata]KAF2274369.1 hypothetical protein EI97DRAFT_435211 [Westerdykella ornata]